MDFGQRRATGGRKMLLSLLGPCVLKLCCRKSNLKVPQSKQQHSFLLELCLPNNKIETTVTVPGSHREVMRELQN